MYYTVFIYKPIPVLYIVILPCTTQKESFKVGTANRCHL